MSTLTEWNFRLSLEEQLTIAMAVLLNLLIGLFMQMGAAWDIFVLNMAIIACILLACLAQRNSYQEYVRFFRDWYVLAFLIIIYLENRRLIPLINSHDVDDLLIRADRFLFLGHDPTVLLEKIAHPALSEMLQLSYASFYFLPFGLCVLLSFVKRSRPEFHICASTIMMGFFLSYLGYYLTPAIGPRFTLAHLQAGPLSGLYSFDFVREMLARGEGMMRDCCPSGHTMISLLTILLARRYFRPYFTIACVWASVLVFSTVYLRYHYVTDLLVGAVLGLVVYRYGTTLSEALVLNNGRIRDLVRAFLFWEE